MAIDDNTVYGLTGAQLKELPGKIEAAKGAAKVLTSADYNYPTDNPTQISLADLPAGYYAWGNGLAVYVNKTRGRVQNSYSSAALVGELAPNNGGEKGVIVINNPLYQNGFPDFYSCTGVTSGTVSAQMLGSALTTDSNTLKDSLTYTTSGRAALDARQGKVIKDLIDALDTDLQSQIDAIVASSDVKDVVGTKADLNSYDTSTLGDNDIIKVLADESQSNATTYYRWSVSGAAFTLIGSEGPYYTKSQTDTLVNAKADASTTYTKSEVDTALNGKVDNATLGNYATTAAMNTALAGKADAPAAGTTYVTDAAMTTALATKANTADLSTVATSGDYDDLTDKPVLKNAGAPTTATVGTKGQLLEDTTNGELYQCTAVSGNTYTWKKITKTNITTMTGRGQTGGMLTEEVPSLLLAGKPTAHSPYALLTDYDSGDNANTWSYIKTNRSSTGNVNNVYAGYYFYDGFEDLYSTNSARLALYSDLPTVNDATLTIQKNGTTVDTFTANSSTNKTVNIETPVITMTTTDPGEGTALAANNFIAVYSA